MERIFVAQPKLSGNERKYVLDCLDTTWISSIGKYISAFEHSFAEFCGVKHAVATNNGTTALHLALVALGLKTGDEEIRLAANSAANSAANYAAYYAANSASRKKQNRRLHRMIVGNR